MIYRFLARRWRATRLLVVLIPFGAVACSLSTGSAGEGSQYDVRHTPYLQLGDAALGSPTDRVDILWQTVPAGSGSQDSFAVQYRPTGTATWLDAGAVGTLDTATQGRVNHFVSIAGLDFESEYDYRVIHSRNESTLATYSDTFRTRLPPGDPQSFTFVAYGDSADLNVVDNFRSVQNQINLLDADHGVAFSLLLGDNAYPSGTHAQFDARLDPSVNPELAQYGASHIDYYAMGNHDARTDNGRPSEENYSVPLNGPASGETPEHNYSFDYGDVHFATFDSNSLHNASRLDNQLDWLVADMQGSTAKWKIVFAHHPVAGSPDKSQDPSDNYYQQVVPRLREAGVDVFMAGHSHLYHWTYPLLGEEDGSATFVLDPDKNYRQGAGLIQLVSGAGGRSLRSGDFGQFPFNAAGYSTNTDPPVEYGFARVDVSPENLTIQYIAADDGAVIDQLTITHSPGPFINGDMDCDGDVDFDDIEFFVLGLTNPTAYETAMGLSAAMKGDIDDNGKLDFDDIPGFVNLLRQSLHAVPEPATWALVASMSVALVLVHLSGPRQPQLPS